MHLTFIGRRHLSGLLSLSVCLAVLTACTTGPTATAPSSTPSPANTSEQQPESTPAPTSSASPRPFDQTGTIPGSEIVGFGNTVYTKGAADTITSFSLEGKELASVTLQNAVQFGHLGCSEVPFTRDGRDYLAALTVEKTGAAGLTPPSTNLGVTVYDGSTLEEVWSKQFDSDTSNSQEGPSCPSSAIAPILNGTLDGTFLVLNGASSSYIIDSATGSARPIKNIISAAGNYVLAPNPSGREVFYQFSDLTVLRPADGQVVATIPYGGGSSGTPAWVAANSAFRSNALVLDGDSVLFRSELNLATGAVSPGPNREDPGYSSTQLKYDSNSRTVYVDPGGTLQAFDRQTGKQKWQQNGVTQICQTSQNEVAAIANGQLVLLSAADGRQLDYTAALNNCGQYALGPYIYASGDGGYAVIRALS